MLVWEAHKVKILSLAFSPSGQLLATATGTTRFNWLWNPTTGELVRKLKPIGGRTVYAGAFAPDAPLFASGMNGVVCIWNTENWEQVATLGPSGLSGTWAGGFSEMVFSRGPTPRLAASDGNRVRIWEDAGQPTTPPHRNADQEIPIANVPGLDFSPSGEQVAVNVLAEAAIHSRTTGERLQTLAHTHSLQHGPIKFSPDGNRIAVGYRNAVAIHPVEAGTTEIITCTGHKKVVWGASWSADGRTLFTGSADGTARQWNPDTGEELKAFEWGIGEIRSTAFSSDGLLGAAASKEGKVIVWDLDT